MTQAEFKVIDQRIGLLSATALIIGNTVAVAVFLLPAHLLAEGAGPSIALAAVVASVPMVFAIAVMLQLGGSMPAAGGVYMYVSRLIGPFWGFSIPWLIVPAVWLGLLFVAIGFAEYVRFFVDVRARWIIWAVLLAFMAINLRGIKVVAWAQLAMVAVIILGMLVFVAPGLGHLEAGNFRPMFPEGYGPFVVAIVSLFIAMYGFNLAIELGEELDDPIRNIPRALWLSAIVAITLMVGVVIVSIGVMDWRALAGHEAGVTIAAEVFLPPSLVLLVAVVPVLGGLTTLNTMYVTFSREVMRAARDEVIPTTLASINPPTQSPNRAILLLGLPPLVLVPADPSPVLLSLLLSLVLLYALVLLGIAVWRLPARFPDRYEFSFYRLPLPILRVASVGCVASAGLFWGLFLLGSPLLGSLVLGWIVLGYPVYRYRLRRYASAGVDLRARMQQLHDHERANAAGD